LDHLLRSTAIGVLATATMDVWGWAREPLFGFPRANYRMIGRWFAHMPRGRFRHASIAAAPALPGEHTIGWIAHYAIGITFAVALVQLGGDAWLARPTIGLALLVGLATLAAPLLVMQPAMGAGIASSKAANPTAARIQSTATHLVYALGLYGAGWLGAWLFPPAR
jgi:hypothetical protein